MSALYQVAYQGVAGVGHGAFYIGKGKVVGVDVTGARYTGSYTENAGILTGTGTLTSAGGMLVTGLPVPPGTKVGINFTLPADFGDGSYRPIKVGGADVNVSLAKIEDIP